MGRRTWKRKLKDQIERTVRRELKSDARDIALSILLAAERRDELAAAAREIERSALADDDLAAISGKLDALGDITQLMQMRLQMEMDAYSKVSEMVSNVMKKFSETADALVKNIK